MNFVHSCNSRGLDSVETSTNGVGRTLKTKLEAAESLTTKPGSENNLLCTTSQSTGMLFDTTTTQEQELRHVHNDGIAIHI